MLNNLKDAIISAKNLLDHSPIGLYWTSPEGVLIECNQKMLDILKHEPFKTILKSKKPKKSPTKQEIVLQANGKRYIFQKEEKLIYDENGKLIYIAGSVIDITKIKNKEVNIEKKLTQSNQRVKQIHQDIHNILKAVPCNLWWSDTNSVLLGCNDRLAYDRGYNSPEEMIGKTYEAIAKGRGWERQCRKFAQDDLKVIKSGLPMINVLEPPMPGPDGKTQYYLTTRSPLRDENNKITGIIGIAIDITDRIENELVLKAEKEKAEISNQAKSDYLATISHELRTPLNGILGMSDLLYRKKLTKDQKLFVEDIINSGKTLLTLINGILDLTKIEEGKVEIVKSPFDLKSIVDKVITQVSAQALQKKITVTTNFEGEFSTRLVGDSHRLYQILINIVGNAVKFTDQGNVELIIKCLEQKKKRCKLSFVVKDTGIGIPKNQINSVFDRFRQLDQSKPAGSGLGLAIVKQLVEILNGEVYVKSKVNVGTTFTVTLSFSIQSEKATNNPVIQKLATLKTLIIDDDLKMTEKISTAIHPCPVSCISSFSKAIDLLENSCKKNQFFQIVLCSHKFFIEDKENINKIKNLLPKLHFPMILSYHGNNYLPRKNNPLLYHTFSLKKIDHTLSNQLALLWEQYETRSTEEISTFSKKCPTILLVEDNVINQRVTTHFLIELGCKYDIANNGAEAITLFKKNTYDLIIMDVGLPDIDGYAVTKKIRALEKKKPQTPIIALTAFASEKDKQKCLAAGMDNVLTKPINRTCLMSMLTTWLNK